MKKKSNAVYYEIWGEFSYIHFALCQIKVYLVAIRIPLDFLPKVLISVVILREHSGEGGPIIAGPPDDPCHGPGQSRVRKQYCNNMIRN